MQFSCKSWIFVGENVQKNGWYKKTSKQKPKAFTHKVSNFCFFQEKEYTETDSTKKQSYKNR